MFVSDTPYRWDPKERVQRFDSWHAAEAVRDLDGAWYLTLSSSFYEHKGLGDDFRIAPMSWHDGADESKTSMPVPIRQDRDKPAGHE